MLRLNEQNFKRKWCRTFLSIDLFEKNLINEIFQIEKAFCIHDQIPPEMIRKGIEYAHNLHILHVSFR